MGVIVNKDKLSAILGISARTLTEYQKEGMPIEKEGQRGQSNKYDTAKVVEWLVRRANSTAQAIEKAKLRLVLAQAELEELKVLEKKEELIPLERMQYILSNVLGKCRAKILGIPSRITPIIMTHKDPKKVEKVLKDACHEALSELAQNDFEPDTTPKASRAKGVKNTSAAAAS